MNKIFFYFVLFGTFLSTPSCLAPTDPVPLKEDGSPRLATYPKPPKPIKKKHLHDFSKYPVRDFPFKPRPRRKDFPTARTHKAALKKWRTEHRTEGVRRAYSAKRHAQTTIKRLTPELIAKVDDFFDWTIKVMKTHNSFDSSIREILNMIPNRFYRDGLILNHILNIIIAKGHTKIKADQYLLPSPFSVRYPSFSPLLEIALDREDTYLLTVNKRVEFLLDFLRWTLLSKNPPERLSYEYMRQEVGLEVFIEKYRMYFDILKSPFARNFCTNPSFFNRPSHQIAHDIRTTGGWDKLQLTSDSLDLLSKGLLNIHAVILDHLIKKHHLV